MIWISKDDNAPCWNKERKALKEEVKIFESFNTSYIELKRGNIRYRLVKEVDLIEYDLGDYP